jgi:hypothetical protein
MKAPFRLYQMKRVSHDTVRCLRYLLKQAEAGDVMGVCVAAMHKEQRHYTVHTCGEAHRNPTFALGMTQMLLRSVEDQVLEEGA